MCRLLENTLLLKRFATAIGWAIASIDVMVEQLAGQFLVKRCTYTLVIKHLVSIDIRLS